MRMNQKTWCIAYINRDYIDLAEEELSKYGYDQITVYIPTVKILKKKFKGKDEYENIPLLFNYGFFEMPYEDACNEEFLSVIRQRITCIYGWVKDIARTLEDKPNLKTDNRGFYTALPKAAVATDEEVANLSRISREESIYSAEELGSIGPGDMIILHGYPFDNIPATIVKINHNKKEVVVKLDLQNIMKQISVSFDNVFYTVYKGFDEKSREKSVEDIEDKGNNSIDKLYHKMNTRENVR